MVFVFLLLATHWLTHPAASLASGHTRPMARDTFGMPDITIRVVKMKMMVMVMLNLLMVVVAVIMLLLVAVTSDTLGMPS